MKSKVILVQMLCIVLVFTCCSCGLFRKQKTYFCEIEKVKAIQIVTLGEFDKDSNLYEYTPISQVFDSEMFVKRLNDIDYSINWGDPKVFYPGYTVIKIEYHNGDFDLIHKDAQLFNISGKYQGGHFLFNDEQFEALISDYIDDK